MKYRIFALILAMVLVVSLFCGCAIENIPDDSIPLAAAPSDGPLTKRDAESIAVQYAGLDMNQISFLYTKLDDDDGISHYEVNFRVGTDEYEIDVHAETGEILEFSRENIND